MSTNGSKGLVVAIIPARGGSKGVPRKNLLPVAGIPLITRAIVAARESGVIDRVLVSTDSAEIAVLATAAGAEVVDRPAELAGDTATSESAILHALGAVEKTGTRARTAVFLQATSPFIPPAGIARAVELVDRGQFDSAFSAYETYAFLWARDEAGAAVALNHDASHRPRRQDREPHYIETGAFYVFDVEGFRRAKHRFFGRIGIVEVPEESAIEIDEPFQLQLAGAIAHLVEPADPIPVDAVVTDFDGVHTDDAVYVDSDGREMVRAHRGDGMGVARLRSAGVPFLILSTEVNPVVRARAEKLGVPVVHGVEDKASALAEWALANGVDLARTAYLGNDVNDLPAMALVGWPIAVADARAEVKQAARAVLSQPGGYGAVRELAERVLAAR